MNKTRLILKNISKVDGVPEMGLIVLVNEDESRQLTIPCDKSMLLQFGLRLQNHHTAQKLLPEALVEALKENDDFHYEVLILDLVDGEYRTYLHNTELLTLIPVRASDGILLSLICNIPVYIKEELWAHQGVDYNQGSRALSVPVNTLNDAMLQDAFQKAIEEERYELASYLRDEIKRRKRTDVK